MSRLESPALRGTFLGRFVVLWDPTVAQSHLGGGRPIGFEAMAAPLGLGGDRRADADGVASGLHSAGRWSRKLTWGTSLNMR